MILMTLMNIVSFFLDLIWGIFGAITEVGFGNNLDSVLNAFLPIIDNGCAMFNFLFGDIASVLVTYILTFEAVKHTYDIIIWVIHKLPVAID